VGAEALAIAVGAFALFTQDGQVPSGADAEGLARVLSYPRVAEALAAETGRDPSLERFLEPVAAAGGGRAAAAPRFLLALCAEARGDRALAEQRITQALDADPTFVPALLRAARYAGERGDTDAVLALLDRAGVELEPAERRQLARFGHNGRGGRPPQP
jgi:tetratricopeptide (TPR) repeat protein